MNERTDHDDSPRRYVKFVAIGYTFDHASDAGGRTVHSRLDYGNGVPVGLPVYLMRQLQSVLNTTA